MSTGPGRPRSASLMWFSHLQLVNWRNFPRVDVALAKRAFVVGPNASGKSNLLDVLRFLRDIASVGGGLQDAVRRRGGLGDLRSLGSPALEHISIRVKIRGARSVPVWDYTIQFKEDDSQRPVLIKEEVRRDDQKIVDRPDKEDLKDRDRLAQTYLEQLGMNNRFRNLAEFFASIRYLHVVPERVRESGSASARASDPYGVGVIQEIAQTPAEVRLSMLNMIGDALRLAVPRFRKLDLWNDEHGVPHLREFSEHWPPDAYRTEKSFSDGTLRFVGMLWALLQAGGPLLLEEPELSLHPAVVRQIPQMIGRINRLRQSQVFVSTHSRDLLEDPGIGLDETLLLVPSRNGTAVKRALSVKQVKALLEGGASLADAVIPLTSPEGADRLSLVSGGIEAAALIGLGIAARRRGDAREAERLFQGALELSRAAGDRGSEAECLYYLGRLAFERKDLDGAKELLTSSLRVSEKAESKQGIVRNLHWLASMARSQGDFGATKSMLLRALELLNAPEDRGTAARTLNLLGALAGEMNDLAAGQSFFEDSLGICRGIGDRLGVARALLGLSNIARLKGDLQEAERLHQESVQVLEST